jgi:hypothetical protein
VKKVRRSTIKEIEGVVGGIRRGGRIADVREREWRERVEPVCYGPVRRPF